MSLCCGAVLGGRLLSPPDDPESVLPADRVTLQAETSQGGGMCDRALIYMCVKEENKPILEN